MRAISASRTVRVFDQHDEGDFFLERLENSVKSLAITMGRTIAKIEDLEERLIAHQKLRNGKVQSKALKSNTDFDLMT